MPLDGLAMLNNCVNICVEWFPVMNWLLILHEFSHIATSVPGIVSGETVITEKK